jgi:AraC-like DNA-binding protein
MHALTGALTLRSARAIEERFFREQFRREWIVAVAPPEEAASGTLLAIDGNQRIISANRVARTSLMLVDRGLPAGISLWSIFERDVDLFRRQDRGDISARLRIAGSDDSRTALVASPEPAGASSYPTNCSLHTRPRPIDFSTPPAATPAHGGLPPGVMRRVREYVEMHLGENCVRCGLFDQGHLARHFRHMIGTTPREFRRSQR